MGPSLLVVKRRDGTHQVYMYQNVLSLKSTHDDNVLADVNVRANHGSIDYGSLADEYVIPNSQREKGHSTKESFIISIHMQMSWQPYPLLNFLNGGRITALELTIQCLPTRTLARSPLMMASDCTMFFPFKTMFWEPQRTDWRLTRFPDAFGRKKKCCIGHGTHSIHVLTVSMYSAFLNGMSWSSIIFSWK